MNVPFLFPDPGGWCWLLTADKYIKKIFFRFVAIVLSKCGWSVSQLKVSVRQMRDSLPCTDFQALSLCQQAAELLQGVYETAKSLCQPSEVHNILSGTDSSNFMYLPLLLSISFLSPSLSSSPSIAVLQEVSLPVQRELVSVQLCMVDLLALVFAEHSHEQRAAKNTLQQKSSIEKVCSIMHVNVLTLRGKKEEPGTQHLGGRRASPPPPTIQNRLYM